MDPNTYLARIGAVRPLAPSAEALSSLQVAHVLHVPFEILDIVIGRAISLELPAIYDKIVTRRRGGFPPPGSWGVLRGGRGWWRSAAGTPPASRCGWWRVWSRRTRWVGRTGSAGTGTTGRRASAGAPRTPRRPPPPFPPR